MSVTAFPQCADPDQAESESVFAALDRVIAHSAPEERPALVVQLAARLAAIGGGWTIPARTPDVASSSSEPAMVTYQDAAKFLGCSVSYVETMVRQGKLPFVKLRAADKAGKSRDGRMVRIMMRDLHSFVMGCRS